MLANLVHRLVYYLAVATVITTVWVAAWAQALSAQAQRRWRPALPLPGHALAAPANAAAGQAPVASADR